MCIANINLKYWYDLCDKASMHKLYGEIERDTVGIIFLFRM